LVKPFKAGKILFNKEVSEWESDDDVMGHRLHAMAGFGCLGAGRAGGAARQPATDDQESPEKTYLLFQNWWPCMPLIARSGGFRLLQSK
jgi:hypothetical protein